MIKDYSDEFFTVFAIKAVAHHVFDKAAPIYFNSLWLYYIMKLSILFLFTQARTGAMDYLVK